MKKESRNWQKIGESLPKEWDIREFWMDGHQIILTSKGIWTCIDSPAEYKG